MKIAPCQKVSPLALELSRYIATAIRKPLPRAVADRAKIHLVDIFAAMVSGSRLKPGKVAIAYIRAHGGVTFASAHDFKRMRDPRVQKLHERIKAVGDPGLTDPQRRWRCAMEIKLKDGRRLTHQTLAPKGSFENPLTHLEEAEKALDLLAPVLGRRRSDALLAALWDFENIKDVRALRTLYAK